MKKLIEKFKSIFKKLADNENQEEALRHKPKEIKIVKKKFKIKPKKKVKKQGNLT